ncbi:MAG: hypothetical protein WB821_11780 [Burkholderiaceae bacterium]
MNAFAYPVDQTTHFELRFQSLFDAGRSLTFPCDATGEVDMDELPARARDNYLYARALIGRDFSCPTLETTWSH